MLVGKQTKEALDRAFRDAIQNGRGTTRITVSKDGNVVVSHVGTQKIIYTKTK